MDPAAIAELTVEMWSLIDAKLVARKYTDIDPGIKSTMLSESMKVYMTNLITESKRPQSQKADAPKDNMHCYKCSRELTVGELGFLEGKTGKDRLCYHCSH
ncbi:unnamed protein product [marine sediment metagenome]|uniref:Uncharacterized protein n=1 Tax=marine sediment metagenome TaxID=412755 RepID=X1G8N7_9ZZZZ